eukprot:1646866-Amphidinium_carterae.1
MLDRVVSCTNWCSGTVSAVLAVYIKWMATWALCSSWSVLARKRRWEQRQTESEPQSSPTSIIREKSPTSGV